MAPLKSLEREYPIIDSNFQRFCASHGIFSVEDLLIRDLYVLVALAEELPSAERLKQGITQVLSIIDAQHQPWFNGMELLEDAKKNKLVLSTGFEEIDMLLQGGLREGHLTELVGPSSSGKTQVCLQVASSVAKKHMGSVVFLDTGNSFSPKRIAHFISQTTDPADKEANHKILRKLMSNISCHSVFDFFTLMDVLHQLNTTLRSQTGGQVKLLVVDSISSLITPILGGRGSHGHALMVSAGFLLKKLAHEHNLCVLLLLRWSFLLCAEFPLDQSISYLIKDDLPVSMVTNHMVGGEGGVTKPALGESWKSIPHVRLQLSRDHRSNICNISILRHTYLASGKAVKFMIL